MDRPSDREADDESSSDESNAIPKIGMINPGFREIQEPLDTKYKSSGPKLSANQLDRKNTRFIILAILISLVIFTLLECKQIRDASLEQEQVKPASLFR